MIVRLHPDVVLAWRDEHRLQIGLHPERGLVLEGVPKEFKHVLAALRRGDHTPEGVKRLAGSHGLPSSVVEQVLASLYASGALLEEDSALVRDPLAAAARTAALRYPGTGGWPIVLGRAHSRVLLVGGGVILTQLCRSLLGAGVGHVAVHSPGPVTNETVADNQVFRTDDIGRLQHHVLAERLGVRAAAYVEPDQVDLAVIVADLVLSPEASDPFVRSDTTHLAVLLREFDAVLGPLVHPGTTACLRCLDCYRLDRDPAWPQIAVQVPTAGRSTRDPLLIALTVAQACAQILVTLDGQAPVTCESATLDLSLDNPLGELRHWPAHERCGCTALDLW